METHGPDKQKYLGPYKLAKMLVQSETQKKELGSQVQELKSQLKSAKTCCDDQKEKAKELTAKLEEQSKETECLHQQMEDMDSVLMSYRRECYTLQQRIMHCNGIIIEEAATRQSIKNMLYQQLSRVTKQLNEERSLKNRFMAAEKAAQKEVERLQELSKVKPDEGKYEKTIKELVREVEKVKAECKVRKDKNADLLRELEEIKVYAQRLSADLDLVRKLKAVRHQLQQIKEQVQILQRDALEMERSFITEVEDFRSQIKLVASTNLTLTEQIEAEDKDTLDSGQETTDLKVEKASAPHSQVSDFLVEASVPEENLTTTTKKHAMWKRLRHCTGLTKKKKNR